MNTTGKVISGLLIGTLIGTLTGLLLAPTTGKTTRKKINKKAKKLVKELQAYVGIDKMKQNTPGQRSVSKGNRVAMGAR